MLLSMRGGTVAWQRSLQTLSECLRLLAPTRWKHGDTALMCLATSQIGYSWIMRPSTLPPSYVHFLNRHGGREMWHYEAVRVRLEQLLESFSGYAAIACRALCRRSSIWVNEC